MALRIAIVGDRDVANPNHAATEAALAHAAVHVGVDVAAVWFATDALLGAGAQDELARSAGVFCTTGSPYRSLDGALAGIRIARERKIPFLGTCGGFQHSVIEYARHVLGLRDAAHGEYEGVGDDALIAPLACSLAGQTLEVEIAPGCRVAAAYGGLRATESYYCSYGIHPDWERELRRRGLPIVGTADGGTPRILELPDHPFFVATLFVPQARSTPAEPHPLIRAFVRAAEQHADT